MTAVRWCLAVLVLLGGISLVSYLQFRFDRSDIRHAVLAVKQNRGTDGECSGRILSRWKGWVEVSCPPDLYKVDVVQGMIEKSPEK